MKRILVLFLFVAFGVTAYAGTKEDMAQIQRNLLEIQQQFWDLEKKLKDNSASVEATVKSVQGSTEELRQVQATLNAKLEKILNELQALHEKVEDTNRRVRDLSVPAAGGMPPGATNPVEEPRQNPNPAPPQPTAAGIGEQQVYQNAMGEYTKGRFEQALRGFQDLLDQFPNSKLSDDAQFMIGESYYGMKEYVDAVSEYDKVIKSYPDSDRVSGARLKKAFSLFSLGKKGQGVIELQQIVQRYPSTKEAEIARQRLEELGLE
ncbi:tol-pal system protein YbgF [bacterium]|nr:tol-pal system protein YbgF [bacterium]MCI0605658.1 tol-pal system protein YbgF [bacterium]